MDLNKEETTICLGEKLVPILGRPLFAIRKDLHGHINRSIKSFQLA